MSNCCEIVVLVLKDVIFRHTESKFLSDFLVEKYGFTKQEDKIRETIKTKNNASQDEASNSSTDLEQTLGDTIKYSTTNILAGSFSDAKIQVQILGELAQKEDVIDINETEKYTVYNSKYQLIKVASPSGYAITQLIERLSVDLGLEIKTKEWLFHRSNHV